ncbi:MAG: hypothetical protein WCL54_03985 [Clostridia bacterium]
MISKNEVEVLRRLATYFPVDMATDTVDWDLVRKDLQWTADLAKSNAEIAMDVVN